MKYKTCNHPTCSQLIPTHSKKAYCEKHSSYESKGYNRTRGTEEKYYHSGRWKKIRQSKLNENPLCEVCEKNNKITQATIVHHVIETSIDIDKFFDYHNLKAVCRKCHDEIHKEKG